jgi:hypothetical protein
MNIINDNDGMYGETLYKISVGTGLAWMKEFNVYAYNEQDAVDLVADYIEENFEGLCFDHYEIADLCEVGETVDEYAEANNLICAGNHGIYINVVGIEIINERN